MNLIKKGVTPLQQMLAALAIFALVMMPMAQVFAQEVPPEDAPVLCTLEGATNIGEEGECEFPDAAPLARTNNQEHEDISFCHLPSGDHDKAKLHEHQSEDSWHGHDGHGGDFKIENDDDKNRCDDAIGQDEDSVTIVAEKIVCTDEADLPNWGDNILAPIDADTASDWVAANDSCSLSEDWDFEWVLDSKKNDPGDTRVGVAGGNWHTFGSTNEDGMTSVSLSESDLGKESKIWLREVLKDNYIPFTHGTNNNNSNPVSAEFYCHTDGLNYDNYEWIDGIKEDKTYHCVAWNVPTKGTVTVVKEVVNDDNGTAKVSDFSLSVGTEAVVSGVSEDFAPGVYTVSESGEATVGYDATFSGDCAKDGSLTVAVGQSYTCTITNNDKEQGVENSCLVPKGQQEEFVVGASPESEDTLQEILTGAGVVADVEDDQYNYEVWNFASDDTDSVTFEVKLLGKQAGNVQEFGYYKAGDTSSFTSIFSVPPEAVGYTEMVTVPAAFADSVGFAIRTSKDDVSKMWYSEESLNASEDHVGVYNPKNNVYVLAFEDLAMPDPSDEDYNDLVVQISKVECTEEAEQCRNLLTNGSFESDPVTSGGLWQKFSSVAGWTTIARRSDASPTTLELHKGWSGNVAAEGLQYAELDGDEPTRIAQSVGTVAGATYKLSWAFAPRQNTASAENNLSVEVEGVQVDSEGPVAGGAGALALGDWTSGDYEFVAGDASTEIAFKDLGTEAEGNGADVGTFLDNAVLCKVKDPVVEPKVCTVTLVSGTDANVVDGSDDNTTVVEKSDALAKLLTPHTAWTALIGGANWIWGDNPVADGVNGVSQTFERKFGWAGATITSAKLYVAADNAYASKLNSLPSGADSEEYNYVLAGQDGKDGQDEYDVTALINPGNNVLSVNVVNKPGSSNPAENPAGLMYKLVITGTGENCEVPYREETPEKLSCSSFVSDDYEVGKNQDFTLSWNVVGADSVSVSGLDDELSVNDSVSTSVTEDTTFTLTASRGEGEDVEEITCPLSIDVASGGHGGSSSHKKGSVLGETTDRPEGGVAGESTTMPVGAPNTGAGGTSPVTVSLPTLLAVLSARASVQKTR
jgi:hypothetical protein